MRPAIEADVVPCPATHLARPAANIVACPAADHARLAARCVDMLQPAAVHHQLGPVDVPEDCESALPLLHGLFVAGESLRTPRALADPRPRRLEIQCRKTSDIVAAEVVERVEAVASWFLPTPPMQKAVHSCHASFPHIGRRLRRQ